MRAVDLDTLCRKKRVQMLRLREVSDLTRQMAQAVDRQDETSVTLLLNMREDPVRQLAALDRSVGESIQELPEADAVRARELMEGSPARTEEERGLCEQVEQYRRLLASVLDLDRRVSLRMGGGQSFYHDR